MRLSAITIENYRSITRAHKIQLGAMTVLVGPNNEGKSNVLRALTTAMNILTREQFREPAGKSTVLRYVVSRYYEWERDFPIPLQATKPDGNSVIVLDFTLTEKERVAFRSETGSKLTGTLPIKVTLGRGTHALVTVHKKGPGAAKMSQASPLIARFVASRIGFEHVPAIRTAQSAHAIVSELVAEELTRVESDERYKEAMQAIANVQAPLLEEISNNIRATLVKLLPEVKSVQVRIPERSRSDAMRRSCEIIVDDGTPTLLQYKGDGIQSLAALGIMRHASETTSAGRQLVIAVEEPESHLHPAAIHELRVVLKQMSQTHQVVVTTHNPLFVDRVRLQSNVLVNDSKARPAQNIQEIRDVLGVRAADNLQSADLVLVVEGEEDRIILQSLLGHHSRKLSDAFSHGSLAIDALGGGTNLSYKLSLLRTSLCNYHCFLDDDAAGLLGYSRAEAAGLLELTDAHFATSLGKNESELEDWIEPSAYEQALINKFGVSVSHPKFRSNKKWSVRFGEIFKGQAKRWDDRIETQVKHAVAVAVSSNPAIAILPSAKAGFDQLVDALEAKLSQIAKARTQ